MRRTSFAALFILGAVVAPAAADKTFAPSSLIIPTSSAYQSDCGAVAVYGLVYNVLRANAWLSAHPASAPGGAIQVYYSFNANKTSPNRCTPTNKNTDPTVSTKWVDGCDFQVYSATTTPVRLVNNAATATSNDIDIVTRDTSAATNVYPTYAPQTINTASGVTTVRYLGGPFVIDDVDAPTFLKLLEGTLVAQDSQGNNIDFSPFRTGSGSCSFGVDTGGYVNIHRAKVTFTAPAPKAFSSAPPRLALLATNGSSTTVDFDYKGTVAMEKTSNLGATKNSLTGVMTFVMKANHGLVVGDRVKIAGVAIAGYNGTWTVASVPGSKTFTVNGPVGALSNSGSGTTQRAAAYEVGTTVTAYTSGSHNLTAGNSITVNGAGIAGYNSATWTVSAVLSTTKFQYTATLGGLLPEFTGSADVTRNVAASTKKVSNNILQKYLKEAGLSFSGAGGCPPGGYNVFDATLCPLGGTRGQIYDTFDFSDFASGKLDTNYKMVWTPHWELNSSSTVDPSAAEVAAIGKISTFLDSQTGLMAECHSIESFEGAYLNGAAPGSSDVSAGGTSGTGQRGTTTAQYQTCVGSASTCSASTTKWGINKNGPNPTAGNYYKNCSDPNQVNGNKCIYFSSPGDPFAQPGDYNWNNQTGSVENFKPNTAVGAIYKPGVSPLISGVTSLDTTKLATYAQARTMVAADYATRSNKDNSTAKANIVYVAGHDVSGVVSGTKVILQTLLLLGEPPIITTTVEVTRSSPITSTITDGTGAHVALVQGTFERVDPPTTTLTANTDTQVSAFRYPDVYGHMRAISGVTTQTNFKDATVIFDAADHLPPTSCDTSGLYGSGVGGCRTVFTNTASGSHPGNVVFNTAAASNTALKTLINTDGGFGAGSINANYGTFLSRIVAGWEETPGSFKPKLGGVDRSTVALVGASLVAAGGGTRPKIVYFGGMDGMLHAVCASVVASTGCDVLGREIWAYIPRLQLPYLRRNIAVVDGSPRVMDVYGDFAGTGTKSFRTILMVQTGKGDAATAGVMPSVVALDVTNPFAPTIVWDYSVANPSSRAAFEPGNGLVLSGGPVRIGGTFKNVAFIQTNNGGTGGVGNVVVALDMETGAQLWKHGVASPTSPTPSGRDGSAVASTAIPGGAVGVDKTSAGSITDVVFGTLYGELYELDATNGFSREDVPAATPGTPLFRFGADRKPIGATPTIYSNGGALYALVVSGGYQDLSNTMTWTGTGQQAVAISLGVGPGTAPVSETSGTPSIAWVKNLTGSDKAFSQAIVVGGEVFITTDSLDINDNSATTAYGLNAADTGRVYHLNLGTGNDVQTAVVVRGGAGSVNTSGTNVYVASKDKAQKLTTGATSTTGESPGSIAAAKVTRLLWLRTL